MIAYARSDDGTMTTKERFIDAINLLKKMRAQARDPNAALPSLEERLEYLQNRHYALAGIVHIDSVELKEKLSDVEDGVRKPSRKSLIKFAGVMQFIRSSANFEKIENTFTSAVRNLRTGFGRMKGIFARGVTLSPRAEAASILEDGGLHDLAEKLKGENLEEQKQVLLSDLFSTLPLLGELDVAERQSVEARAQKIRDELKVAQTIGDVHIAVFEWSVLIQDIQGIARSKKNFLNRFGYRIRDFFGSDS